MASQTRFSLKTLLLTVTLACVWLGVFSALARRMAVASFRQVSAKELFLWCLLLATHSVLCANLSKRIARLATGSKNLQAPLARVVLVLAFSALVILSAFLGFFATLH